MGIIQPRTIGGRILCSGYWGLSRHINYLGEILMALALAFASDYTSLLPYLYPLYYVGLMIQRQRVDDDICSQKYGQLWQQYCTQVPWRIIPYIY
jgi:protein-S-isoprenylcysteine O-methyltransferase Ste14